MKSQISRYRPNIEVRHLATKLLDVCA